MSTPRQGKRWELHDADACREKGLELLAAERRAEAAEARIVELEAEVEPASAARLADDEVIAGQRERIAELEAALRSAIMRVRELSIADDECVHEIAVLEKR